MNKDIFEAHPLASLYRDAALQADIDRYDGLITPEKHTEFLALFGIAPEESEELARFAEHEVRTNQKGVNHDQS